jgi:hypothetical protein
MYPLSLNLIARAFPYTSPHRLQTPITEKADEAVGSRLTFGTNPILAALPAAITLFRGLVQTHQINSANYLT